MNNTYLIDTHILLWWLANDKKLTKRVHSLIEDPDNYILASVVSIWEIVIKKSLKKLDAPDHLKEILEINDIKLLSITADHVLRIESLPNIHNDPFDRLLIAQCMVENIPLVTADKIIPQYNIKCF